MTDFKNARGRIKSEYKTISGAAVRLEWCGWYELYCHTFVEKLEAFGFTDDVSFEELLIRMNQFIFIGDFVDSETENMTVELAAFGLIIFDRLHEADRNMSSIELFELSRQLTECYSFVQEDFFLETVRLQLRANNSDRAKKGHAESLKQKAKAEVRDCWKMWQKTPLDNQGKKKYKGKSAFARDMLTKYENLESQVVISGWCLGWEKDAKKFSLQAQSWRP